MLLAVARTNGKPSNVQALRSGGRSPRAAFGPHALVVGDLLPLAEVFVTRSPAPSGKPAATRPTPVFFAEQARDGFARLGTHKDAEPQQVIHWLDMHRQ